MCYLLVKPKGQEIKETWVRNAFSKNNDGAGISWFADNTLWIQKDVFQDVEELVECVKKIPLDAPAVLHLRWATHGSITKENCHPFVFGNDDKLLVGAHNGVISGYGLCKEYGTDSEHFMNVRVISEENLKTSKTTLEKELGSSKMAFINQAGELFLLNECFGMWVGGCWHSNRDYSYDHEAEMAAYYGRGSLSTDQAKEIQLQEAEEFLYEACLEYSKAVNAIYGGARGIGALKPRWLAKTEKLVNKLLASVDGQQETQEKEQNDDGENTALLNSYYESGCCGGSIPPYNPYFRDNNGVDDENDFLGERFDNEESGHPWY